MAGSSFADDIFAPATISGTQTADLVYVSGNNLLDGTGTAPTLSARGFHVTAGEIRGVDLTGPGYFLKTNSSTVKIGSGANGNSWEGYTDIVAGTLQTTTDNALSYNSSICLQGGATLDMTDSSQTVGTLGDYLGYDGFSGGDVQLGATGALTVGSNGLSDTFSGKIIGGVDSSINKVGNGYWELTGDHEFAGTFTVNQGTVYLGDGLSGSLNGVSSIIIDSDAALILNLADGGVLAPTTTTGDAIHLEGSLGVFASGTNTIDVRASSLEGSGDLFQFGRGRTILLGDFNHTGTTYVDRGVLQVGDQNVGSSLSSSDIVIGNGATLELQLNNSNLNGVITNDGQIFINSVGTINFNEGITGVGGILIDGDLDAIVRFNKHFNTDYSGDTIITSGTLQAGGDWVLSENSDHIVNYWATLDISNTLQQIQTLEGSGYVDMTDASLSLQDNDSLSFFDGVLDGSNSQLYGVVEKNGTGVWAFDGDAYNINARVGGGALVVGSDADTLAYWGGNIIIASRGILAGHGLIDGNVTNDGTVIPGAFTPGVLTVTNDYNQGADGHLVARIEGKNSFDTLLVWGDANIDGKLGVARISKKVRPGDKFVVLETVNGIVDGEFRGVVDAKETMVGSRAIYEDDAVFVEFYQKSFTSLSGLTPNQKEVAKALNRLAAKGKARNLIDTLNFESINQVKHDIAVLAPEDRAMLFNIGFATARIQTGNIERRLDDVRNGAYGFCANGLALSNSRGTLNYDGMPIVNDRDGLSLAGWDGATVVEKRLYAPVVDISNRWGFFATGTGEWADIESTHDIRGAEFTTGGVTVGADYRVADNIVVGISANYANTTSDLWTGGSLDVNSGRGALYASVFTNGLYGNALVGGGYNSYKTRYNTVGGTSHGSADGGEFDAYLGGGYDFRTESGFTVGPVASLQYTYIGLSGYTESGSDAPMTFPSQSQNSLRSALGVRASYAFGYGPVVFRPEIRAQWGHEFLDSTTEIEAGFAAGGGIFRNTGQKIGRDSLLLDAGVVVEFSPNYSVFVYYTGELGRENYSNNGVNGGFRLSF